MLHIFYSLILLYKMFLATNLYKFHSYHDKQGKFIYLFRKKILWFYWFVFLNSTNILFESYWLFNSINIFIKLFKQLNIKSNIFCHCNRCCFSYNWQQAITIVFVCFVYTLIQIRSYVFLINLFILSIIFSKTTSKGLIDITSKKVSLFFVFYRTLFLRVFYYFKQHKFIVWFILIISLHDFPFTFSNTWFENQINADTATIIAPVISENRQSYFVLFVALIHSYNYGVTYFWLTYYIISIFLEHNLYWFCRYHRKEGKLILIFLMKIYFYN